MSDEIKEVRPLKPVTTFDEQLNKIKERGCYFADDV